MSEQLTDNEIAYDRGYNDSMKGQYQIDYSEWCDGSYVGNHSSYKAGYEDAERDNESDYADDEE